MRSVVASYVELQWVRAYFTDVKVTQISTNHTVTLFDSLDGKHKWFGHFMGVAEIPCKDWFGHESVRQFDVAARVELDDPSSVTHVSDGQLISARWEQEIDWFGWWSGFKILLADRKRFSGYVVKH